MQHIDGLGYKSKLLDGTGNVPHEYVEKFAELIILECVAILKQIKKTELPYLQVVNESATELPLSVYTGLLKQHFGVN